MSIAYKSLRTRRYLAGALAVNMLSAMPPQAHAQTATQAEDEDDYSSIVVTGTRIRQGGAQDINSFQSALTEGVPEADALTFEGLMGDHDLMLTSDRSCAQLLCLHARTMKAGLPTRPEDDLFAGLGFDSNIDAKAARREPLNLVAVIDRSGSMSGSPISLVKQSLRQIVGQMRDGDRLSLVIYGSTSLVHLDPVGVKGNKSKILSAIDAIEIDGSTNMEEGLEIGYRTAFAGAPGFAGKTRVMLFTDEQPNVGATDAASFMGMASEASRRGIGLTTIGVSVNYDGALATKISSVRGGNLFFIARPDQIKTVFGKEFENMVNEVAHDVTITMSPTPGYGISGVFGVPDGMLEEGKEGALSVTVPTAFLSSNGGGIYLTLKKNGEIAQDNDAAIVKVALSYVDAKSGEQYNDRLTLDKVDSKPEANLVLAQSLLDQYLVMRDASLAFHDNDDAQGAYTMLRALEGRMDDRSMRGMKNEREMVKIMAAQAGVEAGLYKKMPSILKPLALVGEWEVLRVNGMKDIYRGDTLEFTEDGEMITYFKRERRGEDELYQVFEADEHNIKVRGENLTMRYALSGSTLRLKTSDGFGEIILRQD